MVERYEFRDGKLRPTKEYKAWQCMKNRCLNKNATKFNNYGGRGITVCKKWRDDFTLFLMDMGKAPSKFHTLGRIKNNKGYTKSNCRWEINVQQVNNRRNTIFVFFDRKRVPLAEYARLNNISHQRAFYAYKVGKNMTNYAKNLLKSTFKPEYI